MDRTVKTVSAINTAAIPRESQGRTAAGIKPTSFWTRGWSASMTNTERAPNIREFKRHTRPLIWSLNWE